MKTEALDIIERIWYCSVFFFAFTSSIILMNYYFGENFSDEKFYDVDIEITKYLAEG